MTLIVCLRAQGCIVFAADSLTTYASRHGSCRAFKLHKLSNHAAVAHCGWAGTQARNWRDVFKAFKPPVPTGGRPASPGSLLGALQVALDGLVNIPRSNVRACAGSNTFLAATLDPSTGDLALECITRHDDDRKFNASVPESPAGQTNYIRFLGDTGSLQAHIATVTATYSAAMAQAPAGMSEAQAITFARDAIKNAIPIAKQAGIRTIGGDFVRVLTLSTTGVKSRHFKSGVSCP